MSTAVDVLVLVEPLLFNSCSGMAQQQHACMSPRRARDKLAVNIEPI
jgi:hypothetical protein